MHKIILQIFILINIYVLNSNAAVCNGAGEIKYTNALYTGECKNNKKDGRGKVVFDDGVKYDGDWKNDKKDGRGVYSYVDGSSYDGDWVDDIKEGEGKYSDGKGNIYTGSWSNNKKDGLAIETTQYGTCKGKWKEGKLVRIDNEYTYDEAYAYLNKIRKSVGMMELRANPILQNAAQSHSDYIGLNKAKMNGVSYHHENKDYEGFTGEKATDRTIAAGYSSKLISEGISNHCNAQKSINSLMSAIYHRFGILDFDKNEIGIGFTQEPNLVKRNLVYNSANSKLNILCQKDNYWFGSYFEKVCADEKIKIKVDPYNEAKDEVRERNPKYVVWPVDGSVDNLYYFKDEVPDPMPGFDKTGNPISIQFNPFYFPKDLVVYSFKLYSGDEEIKETRLLTSQTDPNKKFTKNQYALFPHKPLKRDTQYKVVIKYKYDGLSKSISSTFSTIK